MFVIGRAEVEKFITLRPALLDGLAEFTRTGSSAETC